MQNLDIAATERSPAVTLDAGSGRLAISGESYPEDAAAFYGPVLEALRAALVEKPALAVDIQLAYFNSSSAKALMNIFQMLEKAAQAGAGISINWHYHADDDTMQEFGEDFAEDFSAATFTLCCTTD